MAKHKKQRSIIAFLGAALAVLFLDQFGKFMLAKKMLAGADIRKNYGALFGAPLNFHLILILSVIILPALVFYLKRTRLSKIDGFTMIAAGLMFGGIASNFIDRFFRGCIIDYINLFGLFSFNLADLSILFGALILGWKILRK